jgi:DNA-directed RNA polymerase specialized sigma24 family protein
MGVMNFRGYPLFLAPKAISTRGYALLREVVRIILVCRVKTVSGPAENSQGERIDGHGLFAATRWSMVLEAGNSAASSGQSLSALSELCQIYWRPLYLFLRREGYDQNDAQDLTQGFFADLIQSRSYKRAEKTRGRFRAFLLGALKHFVADARDRERAQKRGGGMVPEALDDKAIARSEAFLERGTRSNSVQTFDREWAASLLRHALGRLAQECALAGKADLFSFLKVYLSVTEEEAVPYEEMAQRLNRSATTLRSDVARWRARYRAILREEVRGTVTEDADVDEELRHLCRVLIAT